MSKTGWATLLEVTTRLEAEMMKEALAAQEIPAEIFQESLTHYTLPVAFGALARVEVCVPAERLAEAQAWLADYDSGKLENENDLPEDEQ